MAWATEKQSPNATNKQTQNARETSTGTDRTAAQN